MLDTNKPAPIYPVPVEVECVIEHNHKTGFWAITRYRLLSNAQRIPDGCIASGLRSEQECRDWLNEKGSFTIQEREQSDKSFQQELVDFRIKHP